MMKNNIEMHREESAIIREATAFSASKYFSEIIYVFRGFIIARVLGPSSYGVWSLLTTFFSSASYIGFGAKEAMVRQVPINRAKGNHKENLCIQQSSLTWTVLLSLIISLIVLILSFTNIISEYRIEVRLSGLVFILSSMHFFIPGKMKSEKKTILLSKYVLAYAILNTIFGISLLFIFAISGLLVGMALANISLIIYLHYKKEVSLKPQLDVSILKKLFKIGFPIMVLGATIYIMHNIDKIIVFIMLGSTMTGYYGLATFISTIINYIPYTISAVLFPRMMYKYGRTQDSTQIEDYLTKPLTLISSLLPILLGLIYININLPITYLLPKYSPSIKTLQVLILGLFFSAILRTPSDILVALNKQKNLMYINICMLIIGSILDIITIKIGLGILGVAFATAFTFLSASLATYGYAQISLKKNRREIVVSVIRLYSPFLYTICGLLLVSLFTLTNSLLTCYIRSTLFLVYSLPLVVYVNKQSGIIKKIMFTFRG